MDPLLLAEFELREWFNLIIIVLIFGGSVIGGFLKWLVARFRDEAQDQVEPQRRTPGTKTDVRPKAATPSPPAARPMPQRPQARERPPVARPMPSQRIARAPEQGRPPIPVPSMRKPLRTQPTRRRPPVPGSTGSRRRVLPPDQPLTPRPSEPDHHRAQPPKQVSSPTSLAPKTASAPAPTSSMEQRGGRLHHLDPEGHLGNLEPEGHVGHLVEKARTVRGTDLTDVEGEFGSLRRPTRRALRRAVIMNEILGPPLGLRPMDQMGYRNP